MWGSLIVAGPTIINYLISNYFNNQVQAFDISVSPKLGIKIKRLEFDFSRESKELNGSSRSISLNWSLKKGNPLVLASVGPTLLDNGAGFKFANISMESSSLFAPINPDLLVELEEPFLGEELSGQTLNAKFSIKNNYTTLEGLEFEFLGLEIQQEANYYLSKLTGEIDTFKIFEKIQSQSQKILIKVNGAEDQQKNFIIPTKELFLINDYGVLRADIFAEKIFLFTSEFIMENPKLSLVYDLENQEVTEPIKFAASNLVFGRFKFNLIDTIIIFSDLGNIDNSVATIDATLDEVELMNGDMYLGSIPKGKLSGSFELRTDQDNLNFSINTDVQLHAKEGPDLNVRTATKFLKDKSLLHCLIAYCDIRRIDNQSQIKFGDAILHVTELCPSGVCPATIENYKIETLDTNRFFENLTKSKIFNPFVVATLYSQMLEGQVSGSGHVLNFTDLSF